MMNDYPNWFMEKVMELEQELVDGHISHTQFNKAMDELDEMLSEEACGYDDPYAIY